jgi:PhnB protein
MVIVTPCIHLNGTCTEALALYEQAFGATTKVMLRYADANPRDWDVPLTDKQKDLVYHAETYIGDQRIMLSDTLESGPSKDTSLFLIVTFEDAEGVKQAYDVLQEGSTLVQPMISTTYSSCFVSLIDKFGLRWSLMTEQTER